MSAHYAFYEIRNQFHRKLSVDGTSFAESHELVGDERRAAVALEYEFVLVGIPATIEVAIVAQPPRKKKEKYGSATNKVVESEPNQRTMMSVLKVDPLSIDDD